MNPDDDPGSVKYALLGNGADFSCEVLEALIRRRYPPALLVLPEYPPATRDRREILGNVKRRRFLQLAEGLEIAYAPAERQSELADLVERLRLEFILVACWPYLISPRVVASPACASLNLHPSLLPAWRGADPLRQQLAAGDMRFGVSLHLLDQAFDRGDIVAQQALKNLSQGCTREGIERECARRGADLFVDAILEFPRWRPVRQSS